MIVKLTPENLETYINEFHPKLPLSSTSEVGFLLVLEFGGAYMLKTNPNIMWVGLQATSAIWSNNGEPFVTVREALVRFFEPDVQYKGPIDKPSAIKNCTRSLLKFFKQGAATFGIFKRCQFIPAKFCSFAILRESFGV